MRKKEVEKYCENEEGETIEFGKHFMRCFDKAGKLQFGKKFYDPSNGGLKYKVIFVLDREELINSKEGAEFLMQTIDDWRSQEQGHDGSFSNCDVCNNQTCSDGWCSWDD